MNSILNTYITRVMHGYNPCSRIMKGSEQIWPVISPRQPLPDGTLSEGGYIDITVYVDNQKINDLLRWYVKYSPVYGETSLDVPDTVYFVPCRSVKNNNPSYIKVDDGPIQSCMTASGVLSFPDIDLRTGGLCIHKIRLYWKSPITSFSGMFANKPAKSSYDNIVTSTVIDGIITNRADNGYPYFYQYRFADYDLSNVILAPDKVDFTLMFSVNSWVRNINLNIDYQPVKIGSKVYWKEMFETGLASVNYSIYNQIILSEGMSHILTQKPTSWDSELSYYGPMRQGLHYMYSDLKDRELTEREMEVQWNFNVPYEFGIFTVTEKTFENNSELANWSTYVKEPYMKLNVVPVQYKTYNNINGYHKDTETGLSGI